MSFARDVRGFPKRYNSGHSDTGCKICTIPTESFLRATSSLIRVASLSTSNYVYVTQQGLLCRYLTSNA